MIGQTSLISFYNLIRISFANLLIAMLFIINIDAKAEEPVYYEKKQFILETTEQSNDRWIKKYINIDSVDGNEVVDLNDIFKEDQVWTGMYSCNGQATPFNLVIGKSKAGEIKAFFHFKITPQFQSVPERPLETSGIFTLKGTYDEKNNIFDLKQDQIINMPGFGMIDLEGTIDKTGKKFSGKTNCKGKFELKYAGSTKDHHKLEDLLHHALYFKVNRINPNDYYSAIEYADREMQNWREKIKIDPELETLLKEYPIEPYLVERIKSTVEKKEYNLKVSDIDTTINEFKEQIFKNREIRASKRTISIFGIDMAQKTTRKEVMKKMNAAGGQLINKNEKQDFYNIDAVASMFQGCVAEASYYSNYLATLRLTFTDSASNAEARNNAKQILSLLVNKYGHTGGTTYATHNNQLIQLKRKIFYANESSGEFDAMVQKLIKESSLADKLGTTNFTKHVWEDKDKQASLSYGKIGPKNAMGEAFGIQTEIWIEYSNTAISEELFKQQESFINELVEKSKGASKSNINKAKSVL